MISKSKNICSNSFSIFKIYIKFSAFWKKKSASWLKYFRSYWLRNMWLLEGHKAPVSEHPSGVNVFTGPKHWRTLRGCTLILVSPYSENKSSYKIYLLIRSQILGLLGNTLTPNHMNSPHNRYKSTQQFQTSLSPKPKIFSKIFFHFWILHKIFRIPKKKISLVARIFWKLLTPKNAVTWMPESSRFRTPFVNQRDHRSQTLTKCAWLHFYPSFPLIWEQINL